jgi:toxin ParE1/3/4
LGSLSYSAAAQADLAEIWAMIASSNGGRLADMIVDRIIARAESLLRQPKLGPARPEIAPQARLLTIKRWLILYRIDNQAIRFIRILDGARDLTNLSGEEFPGD